MTCNDLMSFEMWSNMASGSTSADIEGSVFQVLESVVNYVDPTTSSNAMNAFVGSKERVRIPSSGKHCSLQAFVKHVVEHAGLREDAQKRGARSGPFDLKHGYMRGIEWSLRAPASMRAARLFLRARAVIKHVLRAASTLKNTDGEQRALRKFSRLNL